MVESKSDWTYTFNTDFPFFHFRVVSKALFAYHQLVFSFMLCTKIMRSNGRNTTGPADISISQLGSITESQWQVSMIQILHG